MVTLIIWDSNGHLSETLEYLTLRELGKKLVELSEDWILVFDTVRDICSQAFCTMEITKACKREKQIINEHMDADMERGIEY